MVQSIVEPGTINLYRPVYDQLFSLIWQSMINLFLYGNPGTFDVKKSTR